MKSLLNTLTLIMLFTQAGSASAAKVPALVDEVLVKYMDAVNRIDIDGIAATYHFPHFRLAGGILAVWNTPIEALPLLALPKQQRKAAMRKSLGEQWHETQWLRRDLISASADKAHVNTEFVRLTKKGKELGRYNSLYVLTRVDGKWGIKGRSSYAQ